MVKIKETIIVEGKYDKIRLSSLVEANIIQTDGFDIFRKKDKLDFIRRIADKTGILILTDSDVAGFKIRRYLLGAIDNSKIKHAYIPEIFGKEKRKAKPSKEGSLGVEGIPNDILMDVLKKSGVLTSTEPTDVTSRHVTKIDLYEDGFIGKDNSSLLRQELLKRLNLPKYLTTGALIDMINVMFSFEEYIELSKNIR